MISLMAVVAVLLLGAVVIYNKLVTNKNLVAEGWSGIDVQLRRRTDLVPNLVEVVKGYAGHEKTTLIGVTEARAEAINAEGTEAKAKAESTFSDSLKTLFALAEGYPDLKADTGFLELQRQLVAIENGIEYARRYYNAVVRDYNTMTEVFPSNLVASGFRFKREKFFELSSREERKPVDVSFP